jgi:hypothetical protein
MFCSTLPHGVELISSFHAPAAAHLAHTQALPFAESGT